MINLAKVYDYLLCEYPLPAYPQLQECLFQTTDTKQQSFQLYKITSKVPGKGRLKLCLREDNQDQMFHGVVTFYANINQERLWRQYRLKNGIYVEFEATFWEGWLKSIRLLRAEDAREV